MNKSSHSVLLRRTVASLCVAASLGLALMVNAASAETPTAHSDSAGAAVSDSAITTKVKAKFLGDSQVKSSHIKVVTTNGVVTLTGSAMSSESKSAAVE